MKNFVRYVLCAGLAALLACGPGAVIAQSTVTINSLPAANTPLAGTEPVPVYQSGQCSAQSGTCQATATQVGNASVLTGDVTKSAGATATTVGLIGGAPIAASATTDTTNATNISSGNLNIARLPQVASPTLLGNVTGSTAAPAALNPLAVANAGAYVLAADLSSFGANITLSGTPTVDGATPIVGQFVLVASQTTSSQNGIYVVATGAWSRAANFPSGFQINQFCDVVVFIRGGNANQGHSIALSTSGGAITIGTTAQSWSDRSLAKASTTVAGITWTTAAASAATPATLVTLPVANANDCAAFSDTAGDLADLLSAPCVWADANYHIAAAAVGVPQTPAVTGTGCSLVAGSTDNSGAITATGVDTCTLTYGATFTKGAPFCSVAGESGTVLPFISTRPTATAVIFKTAAAGSFEYTCN